MLRSVTSAVHLYTDDYNKCFNKIIGFFLQRDALPGAVHAVAVLYMSVRLSQAVVPSNG